MVYGNGEITFEELSPELQELIGSGGGNGGNGGSVSGLVIKKVVTASVVATEDNQKVFIIPFDDYNPDKCYMDIRIHSTWINPERYVISGNTVTFNGTVDRGVKVFFTLYHLGEVGGTVDELEADKVVETDEKMFVSKEEKEKISTIDSIKEAVDNIVIPEIPDVPEKATTDEAIAGLNDDKYMTPRTTKEAIRELASSDGAITNKVFAKGKIEHSHTFDTKGSTFTIPADNYNRATETLEVYYSGLRLVPEVEYAISSDNVVTLGFEVEAGDSVQYTVQGSSYSYNDLSNLPDLNLKVDSSAFNELKSAFGELKTDRGYGYSKSITGMDLNNITENGKYWGSRMSNMPSDISQDLTCTVDVTRIDNTWHVIQILSCDAGLFRRWKTNVWQPWERLLSSEEVSNPNLLINGDFRIWQNGVNNVNENGYMADQWLSWTTESLNASRYLTTQNHMGLSTESGGNLNIGQYVEGVRLKKGDKLTLSFRAVSDVALHFNVHITDGTKGSGVSLTNVGNFYLVPHNETYCQFTFTVTESQTKDYFWFRFYHNTQCVFNVSDVKLEMGEVATPLIPRPYAEELALCKRYYEVLYTPQTDYTLPVVELFENALAVHHSFETEKRVPPTIRSRTDLGWRVVERAQMGEIISAHIRCKEVTAYATTSKNTTLKFHMDEGSTPLNSNTRWLTLDSLNDDVIRIVADARIY